MIGCPRLGAQTPGPGHMLLPCTLHAHFARPWLGCMFPSSRLLSRDASLEGPSSLSPPRCVASSGLGSSVASLLPGKRPQPALPSCPLLLGTGCPRAPVLSLCWPAGMRKPCQEGGPGAALGSQDSPPTPPTPELGKPDVTTCGSSSFRSGRLAEWPLPMPCQPRVLCTAAHIT